MSHQFWLEIAYVMDSENEEMIVAAKRVAPAAREADAVPPSSAATRIFAATLILKGSLTPIICTSLM